MILPLAIAGGMGLAGAGSGYLANKANRKQTQAQREAMKDAIEYLSSAANRPVTDVFGTSAGPNGLNLSQQGQLRQAAQDALARNLQAQRINNARGLQTDHDAQAQAVLQNSRLANAMSNQSGNTAMQAALRNRANLNNIGKNVVNNARNANALINASAQGLQNNNIGQIGQDTQLTGLGAQYVNSANNINNQFQANNRAYNGAIAQLMANKPTGDGYSGWGAALQSGLGALSGGAAAYLQGLGSKQ